MYPIIFRSNLKIFNKLSKKIIILKTYSTHILHCSYIKRYEKKFYRNDKTAINYTHH